MKPVTKSLIVLAVILQHFCYAQETSKDSIEGIWKGTSLCQVKPSACHDENVVYRITKSAKDKTYTIVMNKIVNGAEEEMGTLDFIYDKLQHTLTCKMNDKQGRNGIWLFKLDGSQMHGTLTVGDSTLFRVIEAKKE